MNYPALRYRECQSNETDAETSAPETGNQSLTSAGAGHWVALTSHCSRVLSILTQTGSVSSTRVAVHALWGPQGQRRGGLEHRGSFRPGTTRSNLVEKGTAGLGQPGVTQQILLEQNSEG